MEIQNKVVIVTGASEGIGEATARRLAEAGAQLALAARSTDKLEKLAGELRGQGRQAAVFPTDMRDPQQVEQMVERAWERFGRLDVLINNAGQAVAGAIADLDLDSFRQVIDLNVFGPVYAMQAAIPKMRQAGGGLIVNISSMVSKMSIPGLAGYASTKAALNMISQTARVELAGDNIRVITVLPRSTATNFGANSLGNRGMRQRQREGASGVVVDPPEYVAGKILEAIQEEPAEKYMEG